MNATIVQCEQRTPEWFQARAGRLTGSCAGDMLATIKSGEAAARRDLRMSIVVERLTGNSQEGGYVNAEMQRGIEKEPDAIAAYEALTGLVVQRVGFVAHPSLPVGCSPDGYVDDWRGLVSVKCPKTATHVRYLRSGAMPADYVPQMLHELWVTDAAYYDFVSFDDRLPPSLQIFYVRVLRNDAAVREYADKAQAFLAEVEAEYQQLAQMALAVPA